jgi:FMN phosphatase YigB (HAD superfamily)
MLKSFQFEVLIFDLDDTLLDTYKLLIPQAVKKAGLQFQTLTGLSMMPILEFTDAWGKLHTDFSGRALFKQIIDLLLSKYREALLKPIEPESLLTNVYKSFLQPNLPETMTLTDATLQLLSRLKENYTIYLVTQGVPESQRQKIDQLKITSYFKQIFVVNAPAGDSKTEAFEKILAIENCKPEKVLSIGNRLSQEIFMAKKLMMKTCHIAIGEHKNEKPENKFEIADWTIHSLDELEGKCQL